MEQVSGVLPFPLLGVDSDNGSEFINNNLFAWCQEHRITFTRSGPWRNNDNCFVEEKNWVVVSRTARYLRTTPPRRCEPWPSCTATRCPRELLPAPDEARGQDPDGGQGAASLRPAAHAPLARPGLTRKHRLGQQALLQVFRGLNPAELKRQIAPMQGRAPGAGQAAKARDPRRRLARSLPGAGPPTGEAFAGIFGEVTNGPFAGILK
jgi:hypothetical protein